MKIDLSIGILTWKNTDSLDNTLSTYKKNGLLDMTDEICILFQEATLADRKLANKYNLNYIALDENVGIGRGFLMLAKMAKKKNILLLEDDWHLVENSKVSICRLMEGLDLLQEGIHCVRYRHRKKYGFPHFSISRYKNRELDYYDEWIKLQSPHLLDSVHWKSDPDLEWPDKIRKKNGYYFSSSRYANWTNNPCLFKRDFYIDNVAPFVGDGIDLEKNISYWWARQNFMVAQGEGLFMHHDLKKYGNSIIRMAKKIFRRLSDIANK